jgi:hypothetical protein
MNNDIERLRDAVGHVVSAVAVEVLFHGVETKGGLGAVLIELANGTKFHYELCGRR